MDWELPETLTFEFLNDLEWKPGPLENYEVCELGLVRRPSSIQYNKGVMQPGFMYAPEMRGPRIVRYRLHKLGSKHPIYMSAEEVMTGVFGRFANRNINKPTYVAEMRAIVIEFNERHFIQDKRKVYADKCEVGMAPLRFCATCGKQTRNYRCDACWAKIRSGSTSCEDPFSEYRLGRR